MTKTFEIHKASSKLKNNDRALVIKVQPFIFNSTGFLENGQRPVSTSRFPIEKIYVVDGSKRNIFVNRLISLNEPQKLHFELQFNEKKVAFRLFDVENGGGPADKENFILLEAYKKDKVLKIELNDKFNTTLYDAVNFKWLEDENFNPVAARNESIQRLKQLWKDNSSDGTETSTINEKSINTVLGVNWEIDFANQNTREEIGKYESQLRSKIVNVIEDKEIKIKFTVKEARETFAEKGYSTNNLISLKIQTDFLMSTLVPRLDLVIHSPQDGPFSNITFIFNNEQANSEVYEMLADSEGEELELSYNLSKIFFEVYGAANFQEDKPKIAMAAERKALEVFFRHSDAPNVITIQKTGENPENDDTPKLDNLTSLLDAALPSTATNQDKIAALKKAGEFLGFISPENQTKITQINQQLANNPTQLCQALSEKIENQLKINNLTINDLSAEDKALYNKLKSPSSVQATQIQSAETKLTQAIGSAGAKKTLDNLETQIRKILSSSDRDEKLRLQKLLRKFIKSKNTFYNSENSRARQLNRELKESIQKNDFNQNSQTPWEEIILFSCIGIGLTFIILLIINLNKNSRRR